MYVIEILKIKRAQTNILLLTPTITSRVTAGTQGLYKDDLISAVTSPTTGREIKGPTKSFIMYV